MKKLLIMFLLSITIISCGSSDNSKKILKLSHNHANGYPVDLAYKRFAEIISNNSEGKYIIEIYPSGQLGDQKASLELAKSDVLQFAHITTSVLENFDPIYSVFNLPYIFRSHDHYIKSMNSEKVNDVFEGSLDKGFITLIYIESGARSIYTKSKEINTPEDLRGLKIRVQDSPTYVEMIKRLGATPVTLNFSEVYTSLQQGVIDGAENNFPSFIEAGHAEVAKNFSVNELTRSFDVLTVGAPFWNSISEEDKEMFRNAAKEVEDYYAQLWAESENKNTERAKNEFNVKIVYPNLDPFMKLIEPMHTELAKKGKEYKELIDYIKSIE